MSETKSQPAVAVPSVVWGVVVLVVAGIAFVAATLDIGEFTPAAIAWAVIGIGAMLIVAAVIGAVARAAGTGKDTEPEASTDRLTDL